MTENTEQGAPGAEPSVTPDPAARKAEIRAQLQALGAALPHHNAGLDKHEAALKAAQETARASGEAAEQPNGPAAEAAPEAERADATGEQPPAEVEVEEDEAEVEQDAAPAKPEPMPAEISGQIGHETRASAVARVDTFLAEARYFLRNLHYEFDGETGEILAFLRAKLLP